MPKTRAQESKICPVCQLSFSNRRKWESRGLWPSIVYCSERCRRQAKRSGSGTGSGSSQRQG